MKEWRAPMRLTMSEKRVLIKSFAPRYRKKRKKVKGEVLTEFTEMTGYNRCYGAYLLRHQGKRIWLSPKVVAVGDIRKKAGGQRARKYDQKVVVALKIIWEILDYLCGKRLVAILPEVVPILERHGELKVDASTRERVDPDQRRHHRSAAGAREAQASAQGAIRDQAGNAAQTSDFRSSVSPTGKRTVPVLWKWTWWAMREA